jgi:acyl carrier protein
VITENDDVVDDILSMVALHGRLSVDLGTLGNDESLFDNGMTSTASVSLMLALQAHFGIEFPDSMLRRSTFESVSAIRAAVTELLAPAQVE